LTRLATLFDECRGGFGKRSTKPGKGIIVNVVAARIFGRTAVLTVILALLAVWLVALSVNPAFADTYLCSGNSYTTCTNVGYTDHGYSAHSSTSYWTMTSGHNCTNYVAYVESTVNGAATPSYNLGNADAWASNASSHGVTVDTTPVVGSVAQWGDSTNHPTGHVAIVEAVNSDGSITVSEDNFSSGPFAWETISTGDSNWPNHFIHFQDLPGLGTQMLITGNGTAYAKNVINNGGWTGETDSNVATQVVTSPTGLQVVLVSDGEVWAKQDASGHYGGWTQEASSGTAKAVAVGGNTQMLITQNGTVYAKNSIGPGGWTQETDSGVGSAIAVSSTGVQMVLVTDGEVWAKRDPSGSLGGWTGEASSGTARAIAVGGDTQMIVTGNGTVYAKNSIGSGGWHQETDSGVASSNAQSIAVNSSGVQVLLVSDGEVWAKHDSSGSYGGWTGEASSGTAIAVAVDDWGDQMIINGSNAVYAKTSIGIGGWGVETGTGTATAIAG